MKIQLPRAWRLLGSDAAGQPEIELVRSLQPVITMEGTNLWGYPPQSRQFTLRLQTGVPPVGEMGLTAIVAGAVGCYIDYWTNETGNTMYAALLPPEDLVFSLGPTVQALAFGVNIDQIETSFLFGATLTNFQGGIHIEPSSETVHWPSPHLWVPRGFAFIVAGSSADRAVDMTYHGWEVPSV